MTTKDYVLLARALGRGLAEVHPAFLAPAPSELIRELNKALQTDNPRFNPTKFWAAVGAAQLDKAQGL